MTDSEKIDIIFSKVSAMQTSIEVFKVKNEHLEQRMTKVEKTSEQYKNDRAKIIGGSFTLSGLVAFFTSWLNK